MLAQHDEVLHDSLYVLAHSGFVIRCCPRIINPECAKTYTDDNFWIIGQARSSFSFNCFGICLHKDSKPSLV